MNLQKQGITRYVDRVDRVSQQSLRRLLRQRVQKRFHASRFLFRVICAKSCQRCTLTKCFQMFQSDYVQLQLLLNAFDIETS